MSPAHCFRLRPGQHLRITDPILGSVRAEVVGWDDLARRVIVRRFDFERGGLAEPESVPPADVLGHHRPW